LVFKILHLSDGSLPDWRIEKAAISSKNRGYEVYFAGLKPESNYKRSIFSQIFNLSWNPKARYRLPYQWHTLKKQMKKIIAEVRPDIIHAHNVFSAKMAKEIDSYPIVYDNHEYWSKFLVYQYESSTDVNYYDNDMMDRIKRNIITFGNQIKKNTRKMWIEWELEITNSYPSLVPSMSIKSDLSRISNKIFVLPNFPLKTEIEKIDPPKKHDHFSSVYAGTSPFKGYQTPIKNIDGFLDLFRTGSLGKLSVIGWTASDSEFVKYHGFMDRTDMINEMSKNSVGFIPWKKHPFHTFCSPNKAYEYAHTGLIILSTNSLQPIFDTLQDNAVGFDDYTDMVGKVQNLISNSEEVFTKRTKTYEFARNNLLWENYEDNIFEAYKQA
jgi:glycosyltransferase involved in cell wall biosynthesis